MICYIIFSNIKQFVCVVILTVLTVLGGAYRLLGILKLSAVGFDPTPLLETATWTQRLSALGHASWLFLLKRLLESVRHRSDKKSYTSQHINKQSYQTDTPQQWPVITDRWTTSRTTKCPFSALAGNRTRASRVSVAMELQCRNITIACSDITGTQFKQVKQVFTVK